MGRRIGILGGTFDPVHTGHLIIGQEVLRRLGLERMFFMPSAEPPHKRYPEMAPVEARAEMVGLAVVDNPTFALSRIELERPGTSYTVETLRRLRQRLGAGVDLYLVLGADNAVEMPTWCDPEGVLGLAQVTVVDRPEFDRRRIAPQLARHMTFLETPLLEISSTDIRARVKAGQPIRYLVPEQVARFIETHGLYR
jgi:nicotinate-nucleotide adenylyltransferase